MAKRRKQTPQRTHVYQSGQVRPGFSRRQPAKPAQSGPSRAWILVGAGLAVIVVVGAVAYFGGFLGGRSATDAVVPQPRGHPAELRRPAAIGHARWPARRRHLPATARRRRSRPNSATSRSRSSTSPPRWPARTSSTWPTPATTTASFSTGSCPDFMIQGGDPQGTGGGGPGYTIQDEPIVGDYTRGMVAMARTSAPNSQGSQFFIIVKDSPFLASGGYTIFGRVLSGHGGRRPDRCHADCQRRTELAGAAPRSIRCHGLSNDPAPRTTPSEAHSGRIHAQMGRLRNINYATCITP